MNAKRPVCAAPALETPAPAASQSYQYCNLEHTESASTALEEEVALAIAYNDISEAVMLVTPTDLADFIVGFSIGSGMMADVSDSYSLELSGSGSAQYAQVQISSRACWNLKQQRRQLAGTSGCGLCGVEAVEQALPDLQVLPGAPLPPAEWLDGLRQRISAFQPLGQHSEALERLLLYFRRQPQADKYAIEAIEPFSAYRIVALSGQRGVAPREVEDTIYESAAAAYHGVFLRRIQDLLET